MREFQTFDVQISSEILKEASVSAVVRFTWRNPETGKRRTWRIQGAEAAHSRIFRRRHGLPAGAGALLRGSASHLRISGSPDSRHLSTKFGGCLRHEVNFRREQKTLVEAGPLYRSFPEFAYRA